jgi:hypothetical protein
MNTRVKTILALAIGAVLASSSAFADGQVKGHVKKDGTYVPPYTRSSPNSTQRDNYSTKGNTNPYTGKAGTRTPKK